ncbi:amidase [Arthrobacter sp. PvP102]|uniref:acetamidase/formamidase family protein n=1 Tax=unclassified Arthrobacter TaxID=235627 RepID=UPI001AEA321C|nr:MULTISPECIES: acetamidase/formamidase family protein [unclassified Arthrobacter]MBP1235243.1 amidase [Arthrobacter sp. PvP103]MBP1236202.1 amidase [Arthrobacter sp. PvP102]
MLETQTLQEVPSEELARAGFEDASLSFEASAEPVLTVCQGEHFWLDARSLLTGGLFEETGEYEKLSIPVTGPVAIRGVLPGDALRVDIHEIRIASRGAMVTLPGRGGFTGGLGRAGHVVEIVDGQVVFDGHITIPVRPMVGKLGVAPVGTGPNSSTVGIHGGNMDCKDVTAGSAVVLPVQVPEAMLYAGDLHAAQGDGECSLTAVEVEGSVRLSCTVVPGAAVPEADAGLRRPVVLSGGSVITIGDGDTLDEAARLALDDMLELLQTDRHWSREKTAMLLSAAADVSVSQLVNARVSAKVTLASRYFSAEPFTLDSSDAISSDTMNAQVSDV